jgi:hypothetical protein
MGYLGASEGLSRIYFVDPKALPGAAPDAEGGEAEELAGRLNLYYWHEGSLRFVALLSEADGAYSTPYGDWRAPQADRTAQATPDGRYLAFMSRASLTGFDNVRPANGHCSGIDPGSVCAEVFEYSAETGKLVCPSCNPTGQAPLGASNLTRLHVARESPDLRQPENLPADGEGRIFFESQDALSPHDDNGHIQDVYEWEPKGVGGCASAYAEGGCVSLISSGQSETDSSFLDATPTGNDAFFITRSKLLPTDRNTQLDLYDARSPHVPGEAVGFPEEARPAPCEGDSCRGATIEAPSPPGAASSTFVGPGNPEAKPSACPKGKVRKGGKCVARKSKKHKHHKKKGHKKQKKQQRADNNRRAGK